MGQEANKSITWTESAQTTYAKTKTIINKKNKTTQVTYKNKYGNGTNKWNKQKQRSSYLLPDNKRKLGAIGVHAKMDA